MVLISEFRLDHSTEDRGLEVPVPPLSAIGLKQNTYKRSVKKRIAQRTTQQYV